MAVDIETVVQGLIEANQFTEQANGPQLQFGIKSRAYLGATILPEKQVSVNSYEETGIRYRSIVANDGTRYSPVQIRSGIMVGSMQVNLGHQDTGSQFTANDYDTFRRLLAEARDTQATETMQAVAGLMRWTQTQLITPMVEKIEMARWQALALAQVVRVGDGNFRETVQLSNPVNHRIASSNWTSVAVDPYDNIIERVGFLRGKGYTVSRIITSFPVMQKLLNHPKILARLGVISIAFGVTAGVKGFVTQQNLNDYLGQDNLPPIETYDLQYQTETGSQYFLPRQTMVFICTTGRDEEVILGVDQTPIILRDTLGYVGVGVAAGQSGPGRVVKVESFDRKPPRLEGEIWQASFPVITEPESIATLTDIPVTPGYS